MNTLRSMYNKHLLRYMMLSALLNVFIWIVLVSLVGWVVFNTNAVSIGWIEGVVDVLGVGIASVIALLLFPFTFPLAISLFYEGIISRMEKRYRHGNSVLQRIPLKQLVWMESKFVLLTLALNIALLPLYFIPGLNVVMFFLYYTVNGYLLGREFFMMVAIRYLPIIEAQSLRKAHRWKVMIAGIGMLMFSLLPVVNIFVPVLTCIFMIHLYHNLIKGR